MSASTEERSRGGRNLLARWRALAVGALLLAPTPPVAPAAAQQAGHVQEVCASCHEGVDPERRRTLSHPDETGCLDCHHIGFTNDPRAARAARLDACAACHTGTEPTHVGTDTGATDCTVCHGIHEDPPLAGTALPPERCRSCHGEEHALHAALPAAARPGCSACHTLHGGEPLSGSDERVNRGCVSCHAGAHPSHPVSPGRSPACTSCHAAGAETPSDPVEEAGASGTCLGCHAAVPPGHAEGGEADVECSACHSFRDDPPLPGARPLLAARCGSCHEGAMEEYRRGGHAEGIAAAGGDVPDCLTCHTVHERGTEPGRSVRLAATIRCIECHSDERLSTEHGLLPTVGASYLEDFHGTTLRFLSDRPGGARAPEVMTCSDCHGAHEVVSVDEARVAEVCLRCHERGDVNLAGAWLGHAPAGPGNNTTVWLVRLVYFVLIPFILAGLALHILFHLRDQRRKGARMADAPGLLRLEARLRGEPVPRPATVRRFTDLERLEHLGSMTTFLLLVLTGLPQIDPDLAVARWVIGLLGGIETTRLVHRIVGFTFVALLLVHVGRALFRAVRDRRLPAMVPTRKDFDDTLATLRHFIRGTPRPRVGKFDFAQKFEYWGLLLGGAVISLTGVVLVFPELVSQLLPGAAVASARVIHGFEATLAVLTVVLWHSWGVVLRPEIFPLDTTIFTGEIEVERLREEHPLEYERLLTSRRPRAPGPPPPRS